MFRRIAAAALILGLAVTLLIAAWPQLFGLQSFPGIAQVVSLRAIALVVAATGIVALVLFGLAIRPFRRLAASLVVLLVAFVAITAAVLATRGTGDTTFESKQDGDLTVLAWNTLGDQPGSKVIADLAIETGADIVSLPETTESMALEIATLMKASGRPMWVHHVAFDEISKARTTSLLTSADLGKYSIVESLGNTSVVPSVIVTPDDGAGPTIIAAHPVAPIPGYLDHWRDDLGWLRGACTGEDIIMAGDLNSTIDHYSGLANSAKSTIGDCADAAGQSGNAAVGTWPTGLPPLLSAPIDHVMATANWRVTGFRVIEDHDRSGSDHRPVLAQLSRTD